MHGIGGRTRRVRNGISVLSLMVSGLGLNARDHTGAGSGPQQLRPYARSVWKGAWTTSTPAVLPSVTPPSASTCNTAPEAPDAGTPTSRCMNVGCRRTARRPSWRTRTTSQDSEYDKSGSATPVCPRFEVLKATSRCPAPVRLDYQILPFGHQRNTAYRRHQCTICNTMSCG